MLKMDERSDLWVNARRLSGAAPRYENIGRGLSDSPLLEQKQNNRTSAINFHFITRIT